jgi:hypothetical protein
MYCGDLTHFEVSGYFPFPAFDFLKISLMVHYYSDSPVADVTVRLSLATKEKGRFRSNEPFLEHNVLLGMLNNEEDAKRLLPKGRPKTENEGKRVLKVALANIGTYLGGLNGNPVETSALTGLVKGACLESVKKVAA